MNIYYTPEDYGLEQVGEVDWSDGNYQFDLTVLWWRSRDEKFLMADDSGCSCPSPFDETKIEELSEVVSLTELKSRLRHLEEASYYDKARIRADCDRLLTLARERGLR